MRPEQVKEATAPLSTTYVYGIGDTEQIVGSSTCGEISWWCHDASINRQNLGKPILFWRVEIRGKTLAPTSAQMPMHFDQNIFSAETFIPHSKFAHHSPEVDREQSISPPSLKLSQM